MCPRRTSRAPWPVRRGATCCPRWSSGGCSASAGRPPPPLARSVRSPRRSSSSRGPAPGPSSRPGSRVSARCPGRRSSPGSPDGRTARSTSSGSGRRAPAARRVQYAPSWAVCSLQEGRSSARTDTPSRCWPASDTLVAPPALEGSSPSMRSSSTSSRPAARSGRRSVAATTGWPDRSLIVGWCRPVVAALARSGRSSVGYRGGQPRPGTSPSSAKGRRCRMSRPTSRTSPRAMGSTSAAIAAVSWRAATTTRRRCCCTWRRARPRRRASS